MEFRYFKPSDASVEAMMRYLKKNYNFLKDISDDEQSGGDDDDEFVITGAVVDDISNDGTIAVDTVNMDIVSKTVVCETETYNNETVGDDQQSDTRIIQIDETPTTSFVPNGSLDTIDCGNSSDEYVQLLKIIEMTKQFNNSTSCGASTVSAYLHNISDCVVRILKCSINDMDSSKIMDVVGVLETYESILMFLTFNARSFKNLLWRNVYNRLRKNRFEKRVMVLCNKYFKNKKVNVVVKDIRKHKQYLMKTARIEPTFKDADTVMFYTVPKPNLKMLIKFEPSSFVKEYV